MDKNRFGESSPGRLTATINSIGSNDWAFVPNELSGSVFTLDANLNRLLIEARAQLGELNGTGKSMDNPELIIHPLQLREALTSSSLEGTYVTPQQFFMFELTDPQKSKTESSEKQDWREVHNYRKSLRDAVLMLDKIPICERLIKQLHKTLMDGVRGQHQSPGEYRTCQVQIGSDARFIPPPPREVPRLMQNLQEFINNEDDGIDPLVKSYFVHYQIETIHPFTDGNGRVGRTLLALMTYKLLKLSKPWLYMSAYFEKYKSEYIDNLFNISALGNWKTWLEFCLRGTTFQVRDSIRRLDAFKVLRDSFQNKIVSSGLATSRTHDIVNSLFETPVLTITSIRKKYKITQPTARTDINRLIQAGIIKEFEQNTKPKLFYSPEIFAIAHDHGDFSEKSPIEV